MVLVQNKIDLLHEAQVDKCENAHFQLKISNSVRGLVSPSVPSYLQSFVFSKHFVGLEKKSPKLDLSLNRFGNFGMVRYVCLKIKTNFTNSAYNDIIGS